MTLREKVGQLNQQLYGFNCYVRNGCEIELTDEFKSHVKKWSGLGTLYGFYRADPWSNKDFDSGILPLMAAKAYNKVQRFVIENSRLKIPALMSSECPHGHQALGGYILPVNLAIGASFNPTLAKKAYEVCGEQLKECGVHFALISMLDVLRDPRWGRSEECFGEDPYLASCFASKITKAVQEKGVYVVAKHLAAQGETTGGVNASAARIGERELREIHLPPAKACCKAGAKGFMAAYNEIDGVPCHGSSKLLNNILRDEMGFNGVVMADGTAIDRLDVVTGDNVKSGALAINSGVDISLWDSGFTHLEDAVKQGLVSTERIDEAVLRVLEFKYELGLFDNPYLDESKDVKQFTLKEYSEKLELAVQSAVLLKNNGALPVCQNKPMTIAVIGPNANSIYNQIGDYSPPVDEKEAINFLQGLKMLAEPETNIVFEEGCSLSGQSKSDHEKIKKAVETAKKADVIILAVGGSSNRFFQKEFDSNGAAILNGEMQMDCGEGVDSANICLPGLQHLLAEEIFKLNKRVISVVIAGRPYAIPKLAEKTDALIYAFYNGDVGGKALAQIIFGERSPSGRMPVSVPKTVGQLPVYYNYKSSYSAMTYYEESNQPLFSFGDGFGYSKIEISNFTLSKKEITAEEIENGALLSVNFTAHNTGKHDEYIVPQLYVKWLECSVVPRNSELKSFDKVLVKAGEEIKSQLSIGKDAFCIWNDDMCYTVNKGKMQISLKDSGKTLFKCVINVF